MVPTGADVGHQVLRAGRPVSLSPTEFKLLAYLMANADRVVSKLQIGATTRVGRDRPYAWMDYGFDLDRRTTTEVAAAEKDLSLLRIQKPQHQRYQS